MVYDPYSVHSRRISDNQVLFKASGFALPIYDRTFIMGILNVTPDSFSDGGEFYSPDEAVAHAKQMVESGADIIDIGGESTRPGHTPVSADEEIQRILPVIRALKQELKVPLSVDTWKASVAAAAVDAGASIINDIWGCRRDPDIAGIAAKTGAGLIVMFNAFDSDLVKKSGNILSDAVEYLEESIRIARKAGVRDDQLMTDPGIGFGLSTEESLTLLKGLPSVRDLGFPVLIGPSRKRFIGAVLNEPVERRMIGTVAACCVGACLGANAVRVHDVAEAAAALKMKDAIFNISTAEE